MIANLKGIEMVCPDNTLTILYNKRLWTRVEGTDVFDETSVEPYIPPPVIIFLDSVEYRVKVVPDTRDLIVSEAEIYEFVRMSVEGFFLYSMMDEFTAMEDLVCS
jgi:hypothetical protein